MGNPIINTGIFQKSMLNGLGGLSTAQFTNLTGHVEFDTMTGNIPLSVGTGQANGLFTLQAGIQYKLEACLYIGCGTSGYAEYQWWDETNNIALPGNQAINLTTATGGYGGVVSPQGVSCAVITPVTTIQVSLRLVGIQDVIAIYVQSYARIEALSQVIPQAIASKSRIRMTDTSAQGTFDNSVVRFVNTIELSGSDITYVPSVVNGDSFLVNTSGIYSISIGLRSNALSNVSIMIGTVLNYRTDTRGYIETTSYVCDSFTGHINAGQSVYIYMSLGTLANDITNQITIVGPL